VAVRVELEAYEQRAVSFIDDDGYPVTVPAEVELEDGRLKVRPANSRGGR
jgi:hypothetical protein